MSQSRGISVGMIDILKGTIIRIMYNNTDSYDFLLTVHTKMRPKPIRMRNRMHNNQYNP